MVKLKEIPNLVESYLKRIVPMEFFTFEEELEFHSAKNCFICEKPLNKYEIKCRDHNHFTGKYRGAAHQTCNINYKNAHVIPVIFHNLSGYDAHFFYKRIMHKLRRIC